eukprot:2964007-Rhodomonas_salina.1
MASFVPCFAAITLAALSLAEACAPAPTETIFTVGGVPGTRDSSHALSSSLLNTALFSNFGCNPSSTVKDKSFQFAVVGDNAAFTEADLEGVDVFFVGGNEVGDFSPEEANYLKDFVLSGGHLILYADWDAGSK